MPLDEHANDLETLLDFLRHSRGFDFTGYKRASLTRRIRKRMQTIAIEDYLGYMDYLEVHADEFTALFNTVLINVTDFFRDPHIWEYISSEIVPLIIDRKRQDEPIRVWAAGCASGEEAYTLAMVLTQSLGMDRFRAAVKIYATDVDEDALAYARQGTYTAKEVQSVPEELRERYFERTEQRFVFRKDLRRSLIFGRHDLIHDAPISRVDLLTCRNTLMYFNSETQGQIMARFRFGLNDGGYLLLGRAEMLFTHANTFAPLDLKRRIFVKLPKNNRRERFWFLTPTEDEMPDKDTVSVGRMREAAIDLAPVPQIVIDLDGTLMLANERARALFSLTRQDIGRPLQDLEVFYRPVELRSLIDRAQIERRPVSLKDISWPTPLGEGRWIDIEIAPLVENSSDIIGSSITFIDVTRYRRLLQELDHSRQELETAYQEVQSTNEELETTNEELQSTVEELETTNEELQSTNEELETMNEELQSTNEELQTINDELRQRSEQLRDANGFLQSILTGLRSGVVVLDQALRVTAWNTKAEDLWGLRAEEVLGRHFLNLDIGLPTAHLAQPIRACLSGESHMRDVVVAATNRRGRPVTCEITCTALRDAPHAISGVILIIEARDERIPPNVSPDPPI